MVLKSPLPDIILPRHSVNVHMLELLQAFGDEIAIIEDDTGNAITFQQIRNYTFKCACAFTALGIKKGDVIATYFSNCVEFSFILIGAAACGAIVTTCNPNYTEDETKTQFVHSQPKIVMIDSKHYSKMKSISHGVQSIEHIFCVDKPATYETIYDLISKADMREYPFSTSVDLEDALLLPYSSGTTGLPKGVVLTHGNVIAIIDLSRTAATTLTFNSLIANRSLNDYLAALQWETITFGVSKSDTMYLVSPTFHIFGIKTLLNSLAIGAKLILGKRFTVEGFFKSVQKYKVTAAPMVAPMVLAIYNSSLLSEYNLSSLRRVSCGAAPLAESVAKQVEKRLNIRLSQGWGLTEAVSPVTAALDSNVPLRSIGSVSPNNLLKVIDPESGNELGPDKHGELCVKGPQIMKGYYKNPQATLNCIDSERWFHTGDIGYYDKNGHIYIVDRLKELIKYKGFQVAPAELEELLLRHPKISDAAVIGIPDREAGEVPKAILVRTDQYITEKDIHVFLNGKVSSYKYLRGGIEFRDSIPKSPSGKILRRKLRAQEIMSKL